MVREGRVFKAQGGSGKPEFGAGFFVTAYEVGAEVSIGSIGSTIEVRSNHGFEAEDKFIVGIDVNRFRRVLSVTTTTLEIEGNVPVAQGELLVNLGQDSGILGPQYDSNSVQIYLDMDYSNLIMNSTVWTDDVGRYRYHHQDIQRWELVRTPANVPFAIYQDGGMSNPDTDIFANEAATGGDGSSIDPWTGWENCLLADKMVRFPSGYYRTASTVTIPDGCSLIGNGYNSRILFNRAANLDIGFVNDTDAGNIAIRNLYINGDGVNGQSANATIQFDTGTAQNYLFENLHIVDAAHTGIRIVGHGGVTNCRVVNCSVIRAQRHGIEYAYDVTYSSIENCYVENTNYVTVGSGIFVVADIAQPTRLPHHIAITGNTVKNCANNGIRTYAQDCSVTGNTIDDIFTDGIRLLGSRQTCSGNTVRGSGQQGIKAEAEVVIAVEQVTITGNTCTGCGESGIQVRHTGQQVSHITITGNTCSDNTLHGIHLRGCEDVVVSGNHCNDNGGANIWGEAPEVTESSVEVAGLLDRILISGNSCYKATTGRGNILVSHTGPINGVVGVVNIVGNYCDGGGLASYGIGVVDVDPGTSVINIIDNISINHAADANLSLVVGCYLRHAGIGTGAFATSTPVKGSLWMQTDGAGTRDSVQVYDGAAWRNALITPTIGAASTDVVTNVGRMVFRTVSVDPTAGGGIAGTLGEIVYSSNTQKFYGKHTATGTDANWRILGT